MRVDTHISGSHVVVWIHRDHYIDARTDSRFPGRSMIERVQGGQVREHHKCVPDHEAPETIIRMMKENRL